MSQGKELRCSRAKTKISREQQPPINCWGRCQGMGPWAFLLHLPLPTNPLIPYQGIRARDQLYQHLEEAIAEKLLEDKATEPGDALAMIIRSTRELGGELSMQELKVGGRLSFCPSTFLLCPWAASPEPLCSPPLCITGTPWGESRDLSSSHNSVLQLAPWPGHGPLLSGAEVKADSQAFPCRF